MCIRASQFPDYVRAARTRGAKYKGVVLTPPELKMSAAKLLEHLNQDTEVVYIDNPNNPTGQVLPLADLETIVAQAQRQNTAVIVDEAYGDFVANENSAINLVTRYPNLAVARSFSKGWGLAGLRVGYGVIAVSYTHLDVYKRQVFILSEFSTQRPRPSSAQSSLPVLRFRFGLQRC